MQEIRYPIELAAIPVPLLMDLVQHYTVDMIKRTGMFQTEIVTARDADKMRMIIEGMEVIRERMIRSKAQLPCTSESQPLHDYYREKVQDADEIIGRCRIALDTWEAKQVKTVGTFKHGI